MNNMMKFGLALEFMRKGKRIARKNWNGKGMYLYYIPANKYEPTTEIAKEQFKGEKVPYRDYIAMKTVNDEIVPWVASQSDILSEDWFVVE